MKLKNKAIVLTAVVSMAFGGVAGAAGSYYAGMIQSHAEDKKQSLEQEFNERKEHLSSQLHHDAIMIVNRETTRVDEEVDVYMNQKIAQIGQDRLNAHDTEITQAADQAIEELKAYIDTLE